MPLYYIRPDFLAGSAGSFTAQGGASSVLDAVDDAYPGTTGTYARSGTSDGYLHLDLSTAVGVVNSGSVIKSVYALFRVGMTPGLVPPGETAHMNMKADLVYVPDDYALMSEGPFVAVGNDLGLGTYYVSTAPVSAKPDGSAISIADIGTNLQIRLWTYSFSAAQAVVYDAWLVVDANSPPFAQPTAPADGSTITTTARPTLTAYMSDPDNSPSVVDRLEAARFRVFSGTGTVVDAWNLTSAEQARLVADSGDMYGQTSTTNATWKVDPLDRSGALPNGSYRWYVRTKDTGSHTWGPGNSYSFTIAVSAPPTPTITGVTAVGVTVAISYAEGSGSPQATAFEAARSLDSGVTWQMLRPTLRDARTGATGVLGDPDAPFGATISYRLRALGTISGEPRPPSAWSNVVSASNGRTGATIMKSADGLEFQVVKLLKGGQGLTLTRPADVAVVPLSTQDEPVVVLGRRRAPTAELLLAFKTDQEWVNFLRLLGKRMSTLLQTCYGDGTGGLAGGSPGQFQAWVRFGAATEVMITTDPTDMAANQRREVTVPVWVVAEPD